MILYAREAGTLRARSIATARFYFTPTPKISQKAKGRKVAPVSLHKLQNEKEDLSGFLSKWETHLLRVAIFVLFAVALIKFVVAEISHILK